MGMEIFFRGGGSSAAIAGLRLSSTVLEVL